MTTPNQPYRWNLIRPDRLGTLLDGRPEPALPYPDDLVECGAKILARSGNGDVHFVGRSADSVFDLLSGALSATSRPDRVRLLPFSYRFEEPLRPHEIRQLRVNLAAAGVSPHALARRRRPIVFADLVHRGYTFTHLYALLRDWIDDEHEAWDVIRLKLRFLGVTERQKTSPKTWRWWQDCAWTAELPRSGVTNVSVDRFVWFYLGDHQQKLTASFRRTRWADETVARPRHDKKTLDALAEAVAVAGLGRTPQVRTALARVMAREPSFGEPWLRSLALELRHGSPSGRHAVRRGSRGTQ
ncbi:hypothetical protein [Microbispora sp. H10836]|uniref:hypothetical protein n=1 Tax=Microbispora sp. H10836 TaxID=2729106 RepID=UPI0020164AE3|nr:hypothetical protein [Microbispora sp. H10836]